jgi:hypothetical protein
MTRFSIFVTIFAIICCALANAAVTYSYQNGTTVQTSITSTNPTSGVAYAFVTINGMSIRIEKKTAKLF